MYLVLGIEIHVSHLAVLFAIILFVEQPPSAEEQQANGQKTQSSTQRHARNKENGKGSSNDKVHMAGNLNEILITRKMW